MLNLTPYILLLPLVGFVALGLFGRALPRRVISLVGCGVVLVAFVLARHRFYLDARRGARCALLPPCSRGRGSSLAT